MQPDSLVFVAILGAWAAYLLPRWVTRRDALGQSRGSDRHSMHMRVLPRRRRRTAGASSAPLLRTSVTPPAPATGRPVSPSVTTPSKVSSAAARAAARRARVLVSLLVLAGASWAVTAVPGVHWWIAVPGSALLVLDVVALVLSGRRRARARREVARQVARRVSQAQRRVGQAQRRVVRPVVSAPGASAGGLRGRAADDHPTAELQLVPAAATASASRPAAAAASAPSGASVDDGTWTPVAVPPPTYTLKPVVHRGEPRPVQDLPDLEPVPATTSPFAPAASGRATAGASGAGAGSRGAGSGLRPWDADHTWADDLDDVLARRRAVNG